MSLAESNRRHEGILWERDRRGGCLYVFFSKAAVKFGDDEILVGALGLAKESSSVAQKWEAFTCDAIALFQQMSFP